MTIIRVHSGEGYGPGHAEIFTGKRTARALKARLTKERAGGDRWAHLTLETGEHEEQHITAEEVEALCFVPGTVRP